MANYYITDTAEVDWSAVNWDNLMAYQYRYESSNGSLVAQDEFERRRSDGIPSVLWRFDANDTPPVLMDHCNLEPTN